MMSTSRDLYKLLDSKETRSGMTYHRKWNGYRHIDADLASFDVLLEPCSR